MCSIKFVCGAQVIFLLVFDWRGMVSEQDFFSSWFLHEHSRDVVFLPALAGEVNGISTAGC
jgi:hypothetical protein